MKRSVRPRSSYPKLSLYEKRESAFRQKCVYVNSCYICCRVLQHTDTWGPAIKNKMSSLPTTYRTLVVFYIATHRFCSQQRCQMTAGFCSNTCFTFALQNNCLPSYCKLIWYISDKYVCCRHTENPQAFSHLCVTTGPLITQSLVQTVTVWKVERKCYGFLQHNTNQPKIGVKSSTVLFKVC